MRLSIKLWVTFMISIIVAVLLFVILAVSLGSVFNQGYTHKTLSVLAENVLREINQAPYTQPSLHQRVGSFQTDHPEVDFELISADGSLVYSTDGRTEAYTFAEYSDLFVNQPFSLWTADQSVNLVYPAELAGKPHYLHLHIPSDAMQSTQLHVYVRHYSDLINLLIPFLVFIVTPYVFTFFFFSSMRTRLNRLNKGLSATTLDQQKRIDDPSKDEIGQLTQHFNEMSARIHDQVAHIQAQEMKRKTLISNLSHDLRTPLTNILGYADTIQKGLYKSADELKAYSEVIVGRSQYMEKLLNSLFEVSRYDLQGMQMNKESCPMPELLRTILMDYIPFLEQNEIHTEFRIPDHAARLWADPHLLERALRNVIDNAVTHGADGHYLEVVYEEVGEEVHISVIDRGVGIPIEQHARLFDRFYQGSQNRSSEGFGLGLSIVKEIARAHGGDITLASHPGQGCRFTLTLPRVSKAG